MLFASENNRSSSEAGLTSGWIGLFWSSSATPAPDWRWADGTPYNTSLFSSRITGASVEYEALTITKEYNNRVMMGEGRFRVAADIEEAPYICKTAQGLEGVFLYLYLCMIFKYTETNSITLFVRILSNFRFVCNNHPFLAVKRDCGVLLAHNPALPSSPRYYVRPKEAEFTVSMIYHLSYFKYNKIIVYC